MVCFFSQQDVEKSVKCGLWVSIFASLGRGFFVRFGSRILQFVGGKKWLGLGKKSPVRAACVRTVTLGLLPSWPFYGQRG